MIDCKGKPSQAVHSPRGRKEGRKRDRDGGTTTSERQWAEETPLDAGEVMRSGGPGHNQRREWGVLGTVPTPRADGFDLSHPI